MKRVLIPILMLGLCATMLGGYKCLAPNDLEIISTPTPTVAPPLETRANPSPTAAYPPSPTTHSTIPTIGDQAPDFTLRSSKGDTITLSTYEGQKNTVLVFYRTGG